VQKKKKILSVDDDPNNNEIIQEILGDDYELRIATTGEEALEIAEDFKPDLILLDVMMPGIDGYETCRRIRENAELRNTEIIMVSAKDSVEDKVRGYGANTFEYITKPFSEQVLKRNVKVSLFLAEKK
jgi:putative two-component system response regulator